MRLSYVHNLYGRTREWRPHTVWGEHRVIDSVDVSLGSETTRDNDKQYDSQWKTPTEPTFKRWSITFSCVKGHEWPERESADNFVIDNL